MRLRVGSLSLLICLACTACLVLDPLDDVKPRRVRRRPSAQAPSPPSGTPTDGATAEGGAQCDASCSTEADTADAAEAGSGAADASVETPGVPGPEGTSTDTDAPSDDLGSGGGAADLGSTTGNTGGAPNPTPQAVGWYFRTSPQGWRLAFAEPASLATSRFIWSPGVGDGGLQLQIPFSEGSQRLEISVTPGDRRDLSGRVLYATVRLDAGTGVGATVFTRSTGNLRADGGLFPITAEWSTVSFTVDSPVFEEPGHTAREVIEFGVEFQTLPLSSVAMSTVSVDDVWYE